MVLALEERLTRQLDSGVGLYDGRYVEHRRVVRWVREETGVYSTIVAVILLNFYCRDFTGQQTSAVKKVRKKAKK